METLASDYSAEWVLVDHTIYIIPYSIESQKRKPTKEIGKKLSKALKYINKMSQMYVCNAHPEEYNARQFQVCNTKLCV